MKAWFKKWWGWLVGIGGAILALLTLGFFAKQKLNELGKVKDQLAIEEGLREVYKLRAVRAEIVERVGEKDEAVKHIDAQLAENKRKIVAAHEGGEALDDEEVEDAFAQLGY